MPKVMVVDDEASIRQVVRMVAAGSGHDFCEACDGVQALQAIEEERPDVLVLDVMLPGMNGFELCAQVRAANPDLPIIFLSAKTDIVDKSMGFAMGGDDYLTKPFLAAELKIRIEALLRRVARSRAGVDRDPDEITFGDVVVRPKAYEVLKGGREVQLTSKEFEMLAYLAARPAQVLTREQIIAGVWGDEHTGDVNVVNVYMRKLREKVEDNPAKPRHLLTVWGVGYKFAL